MREVRMKPSVNRIVISMLFILGLAYAARAQDVDLAGSSVKRQAKACTTASLEGAYSFAADGTITASPLPEIIPNGPYAAVGVATFDGGGALSLTTTESFNGNIRASSTFTGLYTVNPDCTGTVRTNVGGTFSLVIVDKGKEFHFIQTNTGAVIIGRAKRQ